MSSGVTRHALEAWLVSQLASRLGVGPDEIATDRPFAEYGVDSAEAADLTRELELWIGRPLPETILYDHPTPAELARHLTEEPARSMRAASGPSDERPASEPIAVIGLACRFPGADGLAEYWELLRNGVDAVSPVPEDRWPLDAGHGLSEDQTAGMRWGGFLADVDRFDPSLFGISPREAEAIDPQQRLLLELAWHALENAGQPVEELAGTEAAVVVGISQSDYGHLQMSSPATLSGHASTGCALSIAANRLSYALDLHGPSIAVDTACSSSLVAVQLACQSLMSGESGLALAAGVNLMLTPEPSLAMARLGVLAADGRCRAFDERADGYARGEGAGVVVMKPLARAVEDGDPVYAVIRGGAVNNDGRTNGLTAPSRRSQEAVIRRAYERAALSPGSVQYVEAHGTGTRIGDSIEAEALGSVVGQGRALDSKCSFGSVKTNIGHLESAAGIASLIKVALAMVHRELPPSIHFDTPNQLIPFELMPLALQRELGPWPGDGGPLRAGISTFGFGGTNAHLVLEEPPREMAATVGSG